MSEELQYPVAHVFDVPDRSNIWESAKRRLKDIPQKRTDFDVVLDVDGTYELVPSGVPVAKADGIRSAKALVFVDVRRRELVAKVSLACMGGIEQRSVTVRYVCQVVDPVAVLEDGIDDLNSYLHTWTRSVLGRASSRYTVEQTSDFHDAAHDVVRRRLREDPPVTSIAMDMRLADVAVELPESFVDHHKTMLGDDRDVTQLIHRERAEADLDRVRGDRQQAGRLRDLGHDEEYFTESRPLEHARVADDLRIRATKAAELELAYERGPEALLALVAADDPRAIDRMVGQKIQDRDFLAQLLIEAAKSGVVQSEDLEDTFRQAADTLMRSAAGGKISASEPSPRLDRGAARGKGATTGGSDDDFDPDDDSLDDELIGPSDSEAEDRAADSIFTTMFTKGTEGDNPAAAPPSDAATSAPGAAAPSAPPADPRSANGAPPQGDVADEHR